MTPAPDSLLDEALDRFRDVYGRASATGVRNFNAMSLATVDGAGRPSNRMVLLKDADARGFVFYTNTASRKGEDLTTRRRAALCWYWEPLEEQVRVEGEAVPVSAREADAYFATRDRGSRIGAWASDQSRPLESRELLERRMREFESRFPDAGIPRPDHWSGFRIVPDRIEFWVGRRNRLHDRVEYRLDGDRWRRGRLNP